MKNRVYCIYRTGVCNIYKSAKLHLQRDACQRYAKERGWVICEEFYPLAFPLNHDDPIITLSSPALLQKFDVLLVYDLQYLGREPLESPFAGEFFENQGIQIYSVSDGRLHFAGFTECLLQQLIYSRSPH